MQKSFEKSHLLIAPKAGKYLWQKALVRLRSDKKPKKLGAYGESVLQYRIFKQLKLLWKIYNQGKNANSAR